jgi:hypothetical protein
MTTHVVIFGIGDCAEQNALTISLRIPHIGWWHSLSTRNGNICFRDLPLVPFVFYNALWTIDAVGAGIDHFSYIVRLRSPGQAR